MQLEKIYIVTERKFKCHMYSTRGYDQIQVSGADSAALIAVPPAN